MRRAGPLALVVVAGCGGAGGGGGGDPAVYERSGNAICESYEQQIAKLGQPAKVTEIGPYIARAMPLLTRTVERIERLDPPGDRREEFEAFRDAARETTTRAEALRAAAQAADADEVQRLLAQAAAASERRKGLARDAGLDACAEL